MSPAASDRAYDDGSKRLLTTGIPSFGHDAMVLPPNGSSISITVLAGGERHATPSRRLEAELTGTVKTPVPARYHARPASPSVDEM